MGVQQREMSVKDGDPEEEMCERKQKPTETVKQKLLRQRESNSQ